MRHHDVVIIGGGPAGSSCGWRLRRAGVDVLILDRQTFPRDKTCAGWVTPQVLTALDFNADEYRRDHVFQPITGFRTGLIGGDEVETRYDEPVSYGIRRCEFDHYLLQRSGVPTRLGQPIRSLEPTTAIGSPKPTPWRRSDDGEAVGLGWMINNELTANLLIGAGGHFCPVARLLGNRREEAASVVTAQEIEFPLEPNNLSKTTVQPDTPELFFCRDLQGYGWCFRKGNYLNIGLGRVAADRLARHVAEFRDFLRQRGKVTCDIPAKFHGHAYQLYEHIVPKLVGDGVLLVGDSAGLAYPQSGEGIRPAVESALMGADIIVQANGNYAAANLEPYRRWILDHFGQPRTKNLTNWLPASWIHSLAARLMTTEWFARRVVLDRWFLHTGDAPPQFAPLNCG